VSDSGSRKKEVLSRSKFDRYVSRPERELVLAQIGSTAEFVPVIRVVREYRDPKDDKFLEVALNGRADVIITGDADLLAMHLWREIAILSPAQYLRRKS
jgi:putative PIN family toxin of toxin-antitoxin system